MDIGRKLKELSAKLKDQRRAEQEAMREECVSMVEESWEKIKFADAMKYSRLAARCRYGAKRRDGRRFGPLPLESDKWMQQWSRSGREGGAGA
eukprot:1759154-Pyramimonas_sp.AAC.1